MCDSDLQELYQFEHYPLLVVISGPSGAGKDSVIKEVLRRAKKRGIRLHFVVTATTRPRRETEVEGVDYFFVSRPRFEEMIASGELFEHATVYSYYKGVPKQQVREAMASGQDVLMRLDVQGVATIRRTAPEAVTIFITTSSEDELVIRLKRRCTESPEQLQIRLDTAREEMRHLFEFDYVVLNRENHLDEAAETVLAIIAAEKHRTHPRRVTL